MDVFYSYTYGTAGWLALQAFPLIASPTMITALLSTEVRDASQVEIYFSRSLGFSLLTIGVLCVLLTGSVPLSSRLQPGATTTDAEDPRAPYALPTLIVTMIYHGSAAFYSYALWTQTDVMSYSISMAVSSLFFSVGLWCVLFASSDGRISRKTGADKRTSGFPFKNQEADKRKSGNKSL